MNLAAIQAEVPQLEHPGSLCHQQNLNKQILELRQKRLAKVGDGVVIRMQSACQIAKGNVFISGFLDLAAN